MIDADYMSLSRTGSFYQHQYLPSRFFTNPAFFRHSVSHHPDFIFFSQRTPHSSLLFSQFQQAQHLRHLALHSESNLSWSFQTNGAEYIGDKLWTTCVTFNRLCCLSFQLFSTRWGDLSGSAPETVKSNFQIHFAIFRNSRKVKSCEECFFSITCLWLFSCAALDQQQIATVVLVKVERRREDNWKRSGQWNTCDRGREIQV